jgi:hypothetical protein
VISGTRVRLTRTGGSAGARPGERVNAGTWEFDADPQAAARLYEQLDAVRWGSIRAIRPRAIEVDGGVSTTYSVTCARGTSAGLSYYESWTYRGAEAVTDPIDAFLAGLQLPEEAARFVEEAD